MNTAVLVIFFVLWIVSCAWRVKYSLHMFQLQGYHEDKYLTWINKYGSKVHSRYEKAYTIFTGGMYVFFRYGNARLLWW